MCKVCILTQCSFDDSFNWQLCEMHNFNYRQQGAACNKVISSCCLLSAGLQLCSFDKPVPKLSKKNLSIQLAFGILRDIIVPTNLSYSRKLFLSFLIYFCVILPGFLRAEFTQSFWIFCVSSHGYFLEKSSSQTKAIQ